MTPDLAQSHRGGETLEVALRIQGIPSLASLPEPPQAGFFRAAERSDVRPLGLIKPTRPAMIHPWLPIALALCTIRNCSSRNGQFEIHLRPETRRIAPAANLFPNRCATAH